MLAIDRMEDKIAPIDPDTAKIRELISTLELCHHKAQRWVANIVEAIGAGETTKGLGTRAPNGHHPAETIWQSACAALSMWCAGCPSDKIDLSIGGIPASEILAGLGQRSPLMEWQVRRAIEKIRSLIGWARSDSDPATEYTWLLLSGGEYESTYRSDCPECYVEHEDFWRSTVRTIIHDTVDGRRAELPLGLAIDMLWPCHWRFVENLRIVLDAIGGNLHPEKPFAACGRNIALVPNRDRMEMVCRTLRVFYDDAQADKGVDRKLLAMLGEPTAPKKWLAASLDKTIRLQLDPSPELSALSALEGPAWIRR
jgi:hypothetical protein